MPFERRDEGGAGRVVVGNSIALAATLAASWTAAFVGQIVLRRTLGTERVGVVAFYESVTALAVTVIALGVETHIRREVALRPASALEFALPLLRLRLAMGAALVSAFLAASAVSGSDTEIVVLAGVTAAAQVAVMLGQTSAAYLHAVQRVRGLSVASVLLKVAWLVVLLALLADTRTALQAAPIALFVTEAARVMWLERLFRREIGRPRRGTTADAVRVIRDSWPYYLDGLNQAFTRYTIPAILGWFASNREAGLYATAAQLVSIPYFFLPVMTWVLPPAFARLHDRDPERLRSVAKSLAMCVSLALVPVSAVAVLAATPFARLLYGAEFESAGTAVEILAMTVPPTFVSVLLASALVAGGRAWGVTRLNAITLVGMVASSLVVIVAAGDGAGTAAAWGAAALAVWELVTTVWFWVLCDFGRPTRSFAVRLAVSTVGLALVLVSALVQRAPIGVALIGVGLVAVVSPLAVRDVVRTGRAVLRS